MDFWIGMDERIRYFHTTARRHSPIAQRSEHWFRSGRVWGWTIQPDASELGVLHLRYGQPPGGLMLAALARRRAAPASGEH